MDVAVSHHEGGAADNSPATDSGFITIFNRDTGAFIREIQNPAPQQDDYFGGGAMAMSGDKLVVGSPADADTTTDGGQQTYNANTWGSGTVYVFDVTDGSLLHTIANPNSSGNAKHDKFGGAVAIDGDKLVVGAHNEGKSSNYDSNNNGTNVDESAGAAYFYDLSSSSPTTATYTISGAQGDRLGTSVGISGNYVVLGSPGHDAVAGHPNVTNQGDGEARIYQFSNGSLITTLANPDVGTEDNNMPVGDVFGYAVAIDGYTTGGAVFVSAPRETATRTPAAGVTLYTDDGMVYKYVGS